MEGHDCAGRVRADDGVCKTRKRAFGGMSDCERWTQLYRYTASKLNVKMKTTSLVEVKMKGLNPKCRLAVLQPRGRPPHPHAHPPGHPAGKSSAANISDWLRGLCRC